MRPEANMAEVTWRGQLYSRVGRQPWTRKDGSETTLSIWRTDCPACGTEFQCTTADEAIGFKPLRHCATHRRRGWANRVRAIDPAGPVAWPLRPFAPVDAYDDAG